MAGPLTHPFPANIVSDNRKARIALKRSASARSAKKDQREQRLGTSAGVIPAPTSHAAAGGPAATMPPPPSSYYNQPPSPKTIVGHEEQGGGTAAAAITTSSTTTSHSPVTPPDDQPQAMTFKQQHSNNMSRSNSLLLRKRPSNATLSRSHTASPFTQDISNDDTEMLASDPAAGGLTRSPSSASAHLSLPRQTIHAMRRRLSASRLPTRSATNSESETEDHDSDFEEVLAADPHFRSSSRASINLAAVDRERRSSLMLAPTPGLQADDMPGAKARKVLGLDSEGWELGPGADSSPPSSASSSKGFAGSLRRSVSRLSNDGRGSGVHRHSLIPGGLWERATARRQSFSSVGGGGGGGGGGPASTPSSPLLLPSTPSSMDSHWRPSFGSSIVPSSPLRTASPAQPSPSLISSPYAHPHALLSPASAVSSPSPSATSTARKTKGHAAPLAPVERVVSATEQRDWEEELDAAARNASWMSSIAHRPRPKARNVSGAVVGVGGESFGWNQSAVESFGGSGYPRPFTPSSASSRPNSGDMEALHLPTRPSSRSSTNSSSAWRQSAVPKSTPIALSLPPPETLRARRAGSGASASGNARRPMADPHPLYPPPSRSPGPYSGMGAGAGLGLGGLGVARAPMKRSTSMEWINSQYAASPGRVHATVQGQQQQQHQNQHQQSQQGGYVDYVPPSRRRPSLPTPSLRSAMPSSSIDSSSRGMYASPNASTNTPAPPRPRRSHLRTGSASESSRSIVLPPMSRTLSAEEFGEAFHFGVDAGQGGGREGGNGGMEFLDSSESTHGHGSGHGSANVHGFGYGYERARSPIPAPAPASSPLPGPASAPQSISPNTSLRGSRSSGAGLASPQSQRTPLLRSYASAGAGGSFGQSQSQWQQQQQQQSQSYAQSHTNAHAHAPSSYVPPRDAVEGSGVGSLGLAPMGRRGSAPATRLAVPLAMASLAGSGSMPDGGVRVAPLAPKAPASIPAHLNLVSSSTSSSSRGKRDSLLDPDFADATAAHQQTQDDAQPQSLQVTARRSRSSTSPLPTSLFFTPAPESVRSQHSASSYDAASISTSSASASASASASVSASTSTSVGGARSEATSPTTSLSAASSSAGGGGKDTGSAGGRDALRSLRTERPTPADVPRPVSIASMEDRGDSDLDHGAEGDEGAGVDAGRVIEFDASSLDGLIVGSWGSSALGSAGVMGSLAMLQIGGPLDGSPSGAGAGAGAGAAGSLTGARSRASTLSTTSNVPWPSDEDDDEDEQRRHNIPLDFDFDIPGSGAGGSQRSSVSSVDVRQRDRERDLPSGAPVDDVGEEEDPLDRDIVDFLSRQTVVL